MLVAAWMFGNKSYLGGNTARVLPDTHCIYAHWTASAYIPPGRDALVGSEFGCCVMLDAVGKKGKYFLSFCEPWRGTSVPTEAPQFHLSKTYTIFWARPPWPGSSPPVRALLPPGLDRARQEGRWTQP